MTLTMISPAFPAFAFHCAKCGGRGRSISGACGSEPFTFVCFQCCDDPTREAVRLHVNRAVVEASGRFPEQVAAVRRGLGLRRPFGIPESDLSWKGCERMGWLESYRA